MPDQQKLRGYLCQHGLTYHRYLNSEHWQDFRECYRISNLPQHCLVCGDSVYELHHITYERIGQERLNDVVPLCWNHHEKLHECEQSGETRKVQDLFVHAFRMTPEQSRKVLRPFLEGPAKMVYAEALTREVERQVHLQEAKMRCSIGKDRDQHRICLELLQSIQKQARLASRTSSLERP